MAFSGDNKSFVCLGGAPDWGVYVWAWEKQKLLGMVKGNNSLPPPLLHCSFNPYDVTLMSVGGATVVKMFKVSENALKMLPATIGKRDAQVRTLMVMWCDGKCCYDVVWCDV